MLLQIDLNKVVQVGLYRNVHVCHTKYTYVYYMYNVNLCILSIFNPIRLRMYFFKTKEKSAHGIEKVVIMNALL
jgi:hypothetical protein